jgi:hypothetical protein
MIDPAEAKNGSSSGAKSNGCSKVNKRQVARMLILLDQGKPWCITPDPGLLFLVNIFMLRLAVH